MAFTLGSALFLVLKIRPFFLFLGILWPLLTPFSLSLQGPPMVSIIPFVPIRRIYHSDYGWFSGFPIHGSVTLQIWPLIRFLFVKS